MKNTPLHYGISLAILTLALFFAVYFFFSGFNYYLISLRVNVFVLPSIYVLFTVVLLYKRTSKYRLSFKECFKISFTTLFIGGTLSLLLIILFLNYADPDAQILLQHQRIEQNLNNLHSDYNSLKEPTKEETALYKELVKSLSSDTTKNELLFNFKNSFAILGVIYLFYLTISLFLSIFFRLRNPNAIIHSNTPAQRS
ncbi:DUF4199 family protein [Apibacter raozihei]|uniref:DUF4199 family protein n=1 Tax=Apibacter TaxID=1778601 RepID=UPI000FE3865C|nr:MULTISPECIES: DUF4199 family protein [Apibacter]